MKKIGRFLFCLSVLCVPISAAGPSWAQVKGQYSPKPAAPPEEEGLPPTVPRVFSSQVGNVKAAEKLDLKLYDMTQILLGYAEADMGYRKQLYELIEPYKFQISRRKEEFSGDLDNAKKALKDSYKKTKALVAVLKKDIEDQIPSFPEADRAAIRDTGKQAVRSFESKSEEYFRLQAKFIKTYIGLVRFILSNGGSYYYDSARKGIAFYQGGDYTKFTAMIDELNAINFNQQQIIKSFRSGPPI